MTNIYLGPSNAISALPSNTGYSTFVVLFDKVGVLYLFSQKQKSPLAVFLIKKSGD